MNTQERFDSRELREGLVNHKFLSEVLRLVDNSRKTGLVGRFGFLYSPDKNKFYATDKIQYFDQDQLVNGNLECGKEDFYFGNPKSEGLYPNLRNSGDFSEGHLVAQVYTLPKNYNEPVVRGFNLMDLAVARMFTNIKATLSKRKKVFRPFGVILDKWTGNQKTGKGLVLNFYGEKTDEPYLAKIKRGENVPSFNDIAETIGATPVGLLAAAMKPECRERRSHFSQDAYYSIGDRTFDDCRRKDLFDKLAQWDDANQRISDAESN